MDPDVVNYEEAALALGAAVGWIVMGLVAGILADKKGYGFIFGCLWGGVLGVIGQSWCWCSRTGDSRPPWVVMYLSPFA